MERMPAMSVEPRTPEDIEDEIAETEPELLRYLRLLPKELWGRQFTALQRIEREHVGEGTEAVAERRINHILSVVEAREHAITEQYISEPTFRRAIEAAPGGADSFGADLRELLVSRGQVLGSGTTARVKQFSVEGFAEPVAVKYLLTPTAKTLSVQGEHDMLREVETMTKIEDASKRFGSGEYIRVPHPYFYYKRGALQCYGMSRVDGVDLEELLRDGGNPTIHHPEIMEALQARFGSEEAKDRLLKEADVFMYAVHEVCLHGDVKLKNVMVDKNGVLHLIDFGQSVSMNLATEKSKEQFENIQELEREQLRVCIRQLWNRIRA